jgi:hypothetical protein
LILDQLANFAALDCRATSKISDLSGFTSIPFLVNQSLTASVHSSSFLMSVRFDSNVQLYVIGVLMELCAVRCDDVNDG